MEAALAGPITTKTFSSDALFIVAKESDKSFQAVASRNNPRVDELCTKYGDQCDHHSKYGNICYQIRFLKLFDSHLAVLPTP